MASTKVCITLAHLWQDVRYSCEAFFFLRRGVSERWCDDKMAHESHPRTRTTPPLGIKKTHLTLIGVFFLFPAGTIRKKFATKQQDTFINRIQYTADRTFLLRFFFRGRKYEERSAANKSTIERSFVGMEREVGKKKIWSLITWQKMIFMVPFADSEQST